MIRRHSHSGHPSEHPSESGTDWSQDCLLPYYLRKGYERHPSEPLPSVEVDPVQEAEENMKVVTLATHRALQERYEMETA